MDVRETIDQILAAPDLEHQGKLRGAITGDHADGLVAVAEDRKASARVRKEAFALLSRRPFAHSFVPRVIALLRDDDSAITIAALSVLGGHVREARLYVETQTALEGLASPRTPVGVRARAIELLGEFAEIDVLERVCMMPAHEPDIRAAIQRLVTRLVARPRSVTHLRPDHFEHLIAKLLEARGFVDVVRTGGPGDDGVDVEATRHTTSPEGEEPGRWVIQCKRYRRDAVGVADVKRLVATVRSQTANFGMLVTTSTFSSNAKDAAAPHGHLRLVGQRQLQGWLDTHWGADVYCVEPGA